MEYPIEARQGLSMLSEMLYVRQIEQFQELCLVCGTATLLYVCQRER